MSRGWAAIVYGRTYHLDFRFITIPHDFIEEDLNWASQYIVATTKRARNLADSPRWSLFKNQNYCVVGTTCMVKDLIGKTVKDDQGRPLYLYVGYVTQLSNRLQLYNLPAFGDRCLDDFPSLYQEIEKVWLIKNYDLESRRPSLSQYYPLKFANLAISPSAQELPRLNSYQKHPDQIYLWSNIADQNSLLWQAAAIAPIPVSICLNIKGKALVHSLFLNQSSSQIEEFQILEKKPTQGQAANSTPNSDTQPNHANNSLSRKISHRAKEDIDLTLQQAAKMALASQELISNLSDWNQSGETDSLETDQTMEDPEFGFKIKKPKGNNEDWF
ncbi:MAG: hypothetical protein AAFQ14_02365 [Cyanobacteria bacterium J06621_12]